MVRTYQGHILEFVISTPRQPLDMMAVAGLVAIRILRIVQADLAPSTVDRLKLFHVSPSALNIHGFVEILDALILRGWPLASEEVLYRLSVDQSSLELVLRIDLRMGEDREFS